MAGAARVAAALAWLVGTAQGARGEPTQASAPATTGGPVLRIEPPDARVLRVGMTGTVEVIVSGDFDPAQPLLLTPAAEGDAVRVVRGRLLRTDARPEPGGGLRFAVPILARSPGTAVLRVDLLTYRCRPRCMAVHASATRVLQVAGP